MESPEDTVYGSSGKAFPSNENIRKSSHEHYRRKREAREALSTTAMVPLRQSSRHTWGRENIGKKTESLRDIISHALGPLSEMIKKLSLLENKWNILRYRTGPKIQTKPIGNPVGPNSQHLVESLEIERDELSKDLAYWQDQCGQLTAYSNALVDDIRRLQSSLDIQSEHELVEHFIQLQYNIKNCSDHFDQESSGKRTLDKLESRKFFDFVGLDPDSDRYLLKLSSGRKNLSRAYLSRMLVRWVFYNGEDRGDEIKDLWANESTARDLAAMENRMKSIALLPEEFNRWRSMTVRYLAQEPLGRNVRVEAFVDELMRVLLGIFGIAGNSPSAGKLRIGLESSIVIKAVALSQSLRKQLSSITVCNGGSPGRDTFSTISMADEEDFSEGGGEDYIKFQISPAMIRNTDEHGAKAMEACALVRERYARHKKVKTRVAKGLLNLRNT